MESVGCPTRVERADQRSPIGAVGVNGPNAPRDTAANALGFERAEHDAAVGEHDGVQCTRDIQVPDFLEVGRGVVFCEVGVTVIHHEQLQCDNRVALGRAKGVTVAGKDDSPARQGTRSHVEHAVVDVRLSRFRFAKSAGPVRRSGIRREFLVGQPDDFS